MRGGGRLGVATDDWGGYFVLCKEVLLGVLLSEIQLYPQDSLPRQIVGSGLVR